MDIGESFLVTDQAHRYLLPEIIKYAENVLSVVSNNKRTDGFTVISLEEWKKEW